MPHLPFVIFDFHLDKIIDLLGVYIYPPSIYIHIHIHIYIYIYIYLLSVFMSVVSIGTNSILSLMSRSIFQWNYSCVRGGILGENMF